QLRNFGNTPAKIKNVVLAYYFGHDLPPIEHELPPSGAYEHRFDLKWTTAQDGVSQDDKEMFLVKDGNFFLRNIAGRIPLQDWAAVQNKTSQLWLLGYVQYTDRFGRFHKAGYARTYEAGDETPIGRHERPPEPESLNFATKAGYNYDTE